MMEIRVEGCFYKVRGFYFKFGICTTPLEIEKGEIASNFDIFNWILRFAQDDYGVCFWNGYKPFPTNLIRILR